ncbi:interleukin 15, like isoform X2 [Hemibagrus wyckioides]|uniref:interleukin 15, like isoform X2 n=1 Tax=Hemibagrus wyckioides TaxID=337641 RepID=UPI00266D9A25|nr:interleukin 15, like isoform X2 [Hemibagrus wyckioides]
MRRDVVRVASWSWTMVLRRADQHQFYMELTPLLFYFGAMVLRQAKCSSPCSLEIQNVVKSFLDVLSKVDLYNSTLYTPTLNNYKQNCSRSTLKCFGKEMTVLVQETDLPQSTISTLPKRLHELARHLSDKMPCPQCEVYKAEEAKKFLNTLMNILEYICSSKT